MDSSEAVGAFGRRIAALREAKGWTRVELARRLGVSRERLGKWELGEHAPPFGVLIRLRAVLEVSLDELIAGERAVAGGITEADRRALAGCMAALGRILERTEPMQDDGGSGPRENES